ncbi:1457_t:CDS:2, partial [Racocetra persica]
FFDLALAEAISYQTKTVRKISLAKAQLGKDLTAEVSKLQKGKKYELTFAEAELKPSAGANQVGYLIIKQIISLKEAIAKGKRREEDQVKKDSTPKTKKAFNLGGKANKGKISLNSNSIVFTVRKIEKYSSNFPGCEDARKITFTEPFIYKREEAKGFIANYKLLQKKGWLTPSEFEETELKEIPLSSEEELELKLDHLLNYSELPYSEKIQEFATLSNKFAERGLLLELREEEGQFRPFLSSLPTQSEEKALVLAATGQTTQQVLNQLFLNQTERQVSQHLAHQAQIVIRHAPLDAMFEGLKEELQEEFSLNRGPSLFGRRPVGAYLAAPLNQLEKGVKSWENYLLHSVGQELAQSAHVLRIASRDYADLIAATQDALELKNEELGARDRKIENKEKEITTIKEQGRKALETKESEKQKLKIELTKKENELEKTKTQKDHLEKENKQLIVVHADKVKILEDEKQLIQEEKENLAEKSTSLTSQLNSTQESLRSVERNRSSLELQVFNLQNEKERLANRIQILEEQARTITRNYQQMARKCQAYEEIEVAIQERLARNATIADPRDAKLGGQEETIELQKALIAKKVIDIKDFKETIRILSHSYQELLEHKEDLDEEIKDFADRLQKKETKLQEVTTDNRSLQKAKEEVDGELVTQKENCLELENKLQKSEASRDKTQKELSDLKGNYSTLENEKETLNEELIQVKTELEQTQQSLENLQMLVDVPPVPHSESTSLEERLKKLRGEESTEPMEIEEMYAILRVDANASEEEIKNAYKKLSAQYHPDKQIGKNEKERKFAEDRLKQINQAYAMFKKLTGRLDVDEFEATHIPQAGENGKSQNSEPEKETKVEEEPQQLKNPKPIISNSRVNKKLF